MGDSPNDICNGREVRLVAQDRLVAMLLIFGSRGEEAAAMARLLIEAPEDEGPGERPQGQKPHKVIGLWDLRSSNTFGAVSDSRFLRLASSFRDLTWMGGRPRNEIRS